jgi:hypothetical protein
MNQGMQDVINGKKCAGRLADLEPDELCPTPHKPTRSADTRLTKGESRVSRSFEESERIYARRLIGLAREATSRGYRFEPLAVP